MQKGNKRKTAADFAVEHELFLGMIDEKRPELEIMMTLGLSKTQLKEHTFKALKNGKITADALIPDYVVVSAKLLPKAIRELLPLGSEDDTEALVKAESQEAGVLLTQFPADPQCLRTEGEEKPA